MSMDDSLVKFFSARSGMLRRENCMKMSVMIVPGGSVER